jgi:hypothetical protein
VPVTQEEVVLQQASMFSSKAQLVDLMKGTETVIPRAKQGTESSHLLLS